MPKARKVSGEAPGLFGTAPVAKEPKTEAPPANRRPAEKTAYDYAAAMMELIATGINTPAQADAAIARWATETAERQRLGMLLMDERLLKAALDGRCNRVRAGIIPPGRD